MALSIYKRGQGKYTRLCSAFAMVLIVGLGCLRLYEQLDPSTWNVSKATGLWISTMIPAVVFAGLSLLTFWLVNKASIADFMIAAEGEMKKVSWSSRKEIAVSTFIVVVVVILLSLFLGLTDLIFKLFFGWLI